MSSTQSIEDLLKKVRECRKCKVACSEKTPVVYGTSNSKILIVSEIPPKKAYCGILGEEWREDLATDGWRGKTAFTLCKWLGLENKQDRQILFWLQRANCYPSCGMGHVLDYCSNRFIPAALRVVKPELIITLGKAAASWFFQFDDIAEVVGEKREFEHNGHNFIVIPLLHPSKANARWHRELGVAMTRGKDEARSIVEKLKPPA